MEICSTIRQCRDRRKNLKGDLGLVPTMGYLHEGHLSLVRRARAENEHVVASVFVNPTQFGPNEDLASYPRDLPRDLELLRHEGVDLVFTPSVDELYPSPYHTFVVAEEITKPLEGSVRPGHFRGVTTVVAKLFNIIDPTRAYFGQKDAQQAVVIKQMACDLNFDTSVVVCPTVREADGLAMSSRNIYLNQDERRAATILYRALQHAGERYDEGERDANILRRAISELIATEPLAQPVYVSIADARSLTELDHIERQALASLAVRIGPARLIDNMVLGGP